MPKKKEQLTFEEASARLAEIVGKLEKGDAPLDEMLSLYEEGTTLLKHANALLADAERRILVTDGKTVEEMKTE